MRVILYELIEDVVLDEVLVQLLLLLLPVGLGGADRQLVEVLQGDHLLLQIQLYELEADVSSDLVQQAVLGTDRQYPLPDALD